MNVAILGASPKAERYAHKAQIELVASGHDVIPVRPGAAEILGVQAVSRLADLEPGSIHTVTVYVGAQRSDGMRSEFLDLKPERVIFNPGAENPDLAAALRNGGIEVMETCTLILLRRDEF